MRGVIIATVGGLVAASTFAVTPHSTADAGVPPGLGQVIEVVAEEADDPVLDLGAAGFGEGDQLVIADVLTVGGKPVGSSAGTCQVVLVDGAKFTVHCVTTLALPEGQITLQGLLAVGAADSFVAAVTGGTGAYRSAHGEARITPVDDDTERYRLLIVR